MSSLCPSKFVASGGQLSRVSCQDDIAPLFRPRLLPLFGHIYGVLSVL